MTEPNTMPALPKPEHPRPQLVREHWINLNGIWGCEIDAGDSGLERGLAKRELTGEILVPFAPESVLSGIEHVDFMEAVWYRRTVTIPQEWAGHNVLLHFGAVDHDATVWVNGIEVARHRGGFTPFTADLGGVAEPGTEAVIVVRARAGPGVESGGADEAAERDERTLVASLRQKIGPGANLGA